MAVIEKAGFLNGTKPGADIQILEEAYKGTDPASVTVDGKKILNRFNPLHNLPSRFNPACKEK